MINQDKLLACMEEIKEIARSQDNRLTTEEIRSYLNGMTLDDAQMDAIYRYLIENKITIAGYTAPPKTEKTATKAARNLAQYRREVSRLTLHSSQETSKLWTSFLSGDRQAREPLIHAQLPRVLEMAEKYKAREVSLDEVIAEGNLGVLTAMEFMDKNAVSFLKDGTADLSEINLLIEREIRLAMENMIDLSTETTDQEQTILAKANLLHEASKYLAEENLRTPTPAELAEYTRLSETEVYDIMGLAKKQ